MISPPLSCILLAFDRQRLAIIDSPLALCRHPAFVVLHPDTSLQFDPLFCIQQTLLRECKENRSLSMVLKLGEPRRPADGIVPHLKKKSNANKVAPKLSPN